MRFGPLGLWEIIIILVVVLVVFGPSRLPQMAKGFGQSIREFRKGIRDMKDDLEAGMREDDVKVKTSSLPHTTTTVTNGVTTHGVTTHEAPPLAPASEWDVLKAEQEALRLERAKLEERERLLRERERSNV